MSLSVKDPEEAIILQERQELRLRLPKNDIDRLQEINQLTVNRESAEIAIVESKGYVGAIGLPSGQLLEIWPKVECNLLYLLAYDDRLDNELVYGDAAGFEIGESFVEIIARLYIRELKRVLKRGLYRDYREHTGREKHLRGRLDLHRQLQHQEPHGTEFEVEYDDLTYDLPINQVILRATTMLRRLVNDQSLLSELNRYHGMLHQRLEPRELTRSEVENISLSRLNSYYQSLLELAQMILEHSFINAIGTSQTQFRTFLIDIEQLFEKVVQRSVRETLGQNYSMNTGQVGHLAANTNGETIQGLEPDFTLTNKKSGAVVLVGDAKWKSDSQPARGDLYQISTYMAKFDAPGLLVYPDQGGKATDRYSFDTDDAANPHRPLHTIELPFDAKSYEDFPKSVEAAISNQIQQIMEATYNS
ncbi:McrC family protein [Natronoarchaeum sp. GCM10025703]|uniref:McrC family protein n=1 Tax=unclassified Natronoarchaeum TaxID=2620183 RepID=UPI00361E2E16